MIELSSFDEEGPVEENRKILKVLKILVVGEIGVGKTHIIRRYVEGSFRESYKATIGVDFANKDFDWDDHTSISFQLWDVSGQERYGNMTHVYYQEAVAAFVVFDVTQVHTLDMAAEWKKDIDLKMLTSEDKPFPCLLLGNRIDRCQDGRWARSAEEMEAYVKQHGFIGFFTTSARDGTNIDEAVKTLVKYVLDHKIEPFSAKYDEVVDIAASTVQRASGAGCRI
jgi:small GTP-binding protein